MNIDSPIFFYDGECGVCDATISFFLRHSEPGKLHFAALQSKLAQSLLAKEGIVDPDIKAAYFSGPNGIVSKSSAVLGGLACCRKPYSLLVCFGVIPQVIRDAAYDFVARNRHRISRLSKTECRIPSAEEKARFLMER